MLVWAVEGTHTHAQNRGSLYLVAPRPVPSPIGVREVGVGGRGRGREQHAVAAGIAPRPWWLLFVPDVAAVVGPRPFGVAHAGHHIQTFTVVAPDPVVPHVRAFVLEVKLVAAVFQRPGIRLGDRVAPSVHDFLMVRAYSFSGDGQAAKEK